MINWTIHNLNILSTEFRESIVRNTKLDIKAKVRLGQCGNGQMPNYQVEHANGTVVTFSGRTHQELGHEFFNLNNVSDRFSIQQLI